MLHHAQTLDGKSVAVLGYRADNAVLDPGVLESVTYPAAGATTAGNGTSGTWSYDSLGRVTGLAWAGPGGTITSDAVTRSLSGTILSNTIDGGLAWTYSYDGADRLVRAVGSGHDFQYGYSPTGGCGVNTAAGSSSNRTSLVDNAASVAGYCYDNADRLTSTSQPGYAGPIVYDNRGNIVTMAGDSYSYDYANRHMATAHGATTVTYTRDASDEIVARHDSTSGATVRYADAGLVLTATNTVIEQTVSLPGGVLVTRRPGGDVWSYPNIHGDITATCDAAGSKQGATLRYDPWGNTLGTTVDNSTGSWDYGWVGQHVKGSEHATGLAPVIEMGARIYNPTLGRFHTTDPIEGGTPNNYVYPTDPINQYDLDGTNKCELGWNPVRWGGNAVDCASKAKRRLIEASNSTINAPWTWGSWLLAKASGARCTRTQGANVCYGVKGPLRHFMPKNGLTLGGTVLFKSRTVSPTLLAHEISHTRQWGALGVGGPFAYPLAYASAGVRSYPRCNPFERYAAYGSKHGC